MNVWFNKSFSVAASLIRALDGTRYVVHASHTDPTHPALHAARHAFLEPRGLIGERYVRWMLSEARARDIQLIVASKERERLADHVQAFRAAGVTLITPTTRALQDHLERKDEFLRGWDAGILPIPAWRSFHDLASFDQAASELRAPDVRLCMKPARGIYASGFRVLTEQPDRDRFFGGELYQMTYAAARELLTGEPVAPMLLMHTLEGAERSIDCVAWQGELLAAVVRRKSGTSQLLEDRPDLLDAAQKIARRYELSGLFNFQTKDQHGAAHMLEINARPSGGVYLAMAGGVNLPRLMLDAATGERRRERSAVNLTVTEHKVARIVQAAAAPAADPAVLESSGQLVGA
ncbi:ATP-grasp domain-containing protein (plasmid) [Deinococcus taeanensis]|uniref:ATP-grasp domain-containing protein n=1 Tax=Deinococcus taeanensis TaxID=2737050 RepID=UPI001CDC3B81|nr:ATP-grasp domain-containing protein [Deinococcus taeanensis]UBV44616.1 ATP-grasp domain-containing protein [Deinococcus taeanensis]